MQKVEWSFRALALGAIAAAGAASVAACNLPHSGLGPLRGSPQDASAEVDSSLAGDDNADAGGTVTEDTGTTMPAGDATTGDDAASIDGGTPADAGPPDAPPVCSPTDAGLGELALSSFVMAGTASFDENSDGKITLTNSSTSQVGAAWYPDQMARVGGYDLTWSLRVGPGDTAGDGIAFAVLESQGVLGVGMGGDGVGLNGIKDTDGSVPSGYAVDVDMYQNSTDPTDLAPSTLKLIAMPGFNVVAATPVPGSAPLNDGNVYEVDVSWRAPSTLTAVLHAPGGQLVKVSSSDPGLTAGPAYLGFTSATGGISNSHNEVASVTMVNVCAP